MQRLEHLFGLDEEMIARKKMSNYTPPYTITSKMLTLATSIGEELTKIEFEANKTITPMLRKKTVSKP